MEITKREYKEVTYEELLEKLKTYIKDEEELKTIDVGNLTPIEALNKLYELQNKIKNRW